MLVMHNILWQPDFHNLPLHGMLFFLRDFTLTGLIWISIRKAMWALSGNLDIPNRLEIGLQISHVLLLIPVFTYLSV